ncbi:hypothetical protein OG21DRAFT_1488587 [Imleria badia]|nr:hypothetical protein OG21DRAFT_1488587 [Imleria badia]
MATPKTGKSALPFGGTGAVGKPLSELLSSDNWTGVGEYWLKADGRDPVYVGMIWLGSVASHGNLGSAFCVSRLLLFDWLTYPYLCLQGQICRGGGVAMSGPSVD